MLQDLTIEANADYFENEEYLAHLEDQAQEDMYVRSYCMEG